MLRHRSAIHASVTMAFLGLVAGGCSSGSRPTGPTPTMASADASPPAPPPAPPVPAAPASARYRVTFEATWRAATHPQDFPGNAHFSGLIGGTHTSAVTFWQPGMLATEGIQAMAERGFKVYLQREVEQAIAAGNAQFVLSGGNLGGSPASVSLEFGITRDYPLATLVTMVAPSPDWFVGVAGLALFEDGAWKDDVHIDLFPYDAGTDSGVSFGSPDQETRPRQPIARVLGFPFLNGATVLPLGRFRFERIPL